MSIINKISICSSQFFGHDPYCRQSSMTFWRSESMFFLNQKKGNQNYLKTVYKGALVYCTGTFFKVAPFGIKLMNRFFQAIFFFIRFGSCNAKFSFLARVRKKPGSGSVFIFKGWIRVIAAAVVIFFLLSGSASLCGAGREYNHSPETTCLAGSQP